MAKMKGVFTTMIGKVGNTVMATHHGQQIIKTRVIPSNPRSSSQVANRSCLSDISGIFKCLLATFIAYFWNPFQKVANSGWSAFVKANKLAMGTSFDAELLIFSQGCLEPVYDLEATYDNSAGEVSVAFSETCYLNGLSTDSLSFIAVDKSTNEILGYQIAFATRDDEGALFNVAPGATATNVLLFAVVSDTDPTSSVPTKVSTSIFCTCTAPE